MDERVTPSNKEPWEQNSYRTGSTHPPKNRGGMVAVLLIAVIFLGGLSSALGILNIRLFSQLQEQKDPSSTVSFYGSTEDNTLPTGGVLSTSPTDATSPTGDEIVELNTTPTGPENIPQEGGLSLQSIYDKNIPSVVSISCAMDGGSSSGTGVVLTESGYIVTNCHVVEGALAIQVLLSDGRELPADLVGSDAVSDLAVLFVDAPDLTAAEFGDSAGLRVGDAVVAIGDPLGVELRGTMTDGIVSAINRDMTVSGRNMTLIQTNAALNSGNSGGPLINCYGQVIGINTMKIGAFTDDAGVEGLGFAIPSTTVKEIVDQLIAQGYVSGRPDLGITGRSVSTMEQRFYRLPAGLLVTGVEANSAAAAIGMEAGDILVQLDGTYITDADNLATVIYNHQVGDSLEAVIFRSGKYYTVTITLTEATG